MPLVTSTYSIASLSSPSSTRGNKFGESFKGAEMNSLAANPGFGKPEVAEEEAQCCVYPSHITRRERKSVAGFKQTPGQTSLC